MELDWEWICIQVLSKCTDGRSGYSCRFQSQSLCFSSGIILRNGENVLILCLPIAESESLPHSHEKNKVNMQNGSKTLIKDPPCYLLPGHIQEDKNFWNLCVDMGIRIVTTLSQATPNQEHTMSIWVLRLRKSNIERKRLYNWRIQWLYSVDLKIGKNWSTPTLWHIPHFQILNHLPLDRRMSKQDKGWPVLFFSRCRKFFLQV